MFHCKVHIKKGFAFCLILFTLNLLLAQEQLLYYPYIQNYTLEKTPLTKPVYQITSAEDGYIYLMNQHAIAVFDGHGFDIIKEGKFNSNNNLTFTNQKLFYIIEGSIGFLAKNNSAGKYTDSILVEDKKIRNAYGSKCIHAIGDTVYFVTHHHVFKWNGDSIIQFDARLSFNASFIFSEKLVVFEKGIGFYNLDDGKKLITINQEELINERVNDIILTKNNDLLANFIRNGIYKFTDTKFSPFNIQDKYLLKGIQLSDSVYLYVSVLNGLMMIKADGTIVNVAKNESGLSDNTLNDICLDVSGNVWVCGSGGISRIETSTPFNFMNQDHGLPGNIFKLANLNNNLYVGTKNGVYFLNQQFEPYNRTKLSFMDEMFTPLENMPFRAYQFLSFQEKNLVATSGGIYVIENDIIYKLNDKNHFRTLKSSVKKYLFIPYNYGLQLFEVHNNKLLRVGYEKWMLGYILYNKEQTKFYNITIDSIQTIDLMIKNGYPDLKKGKSSVFYPKEEYKTQDFHYFVDEDGLLNISTPGKVEVLNHDNSLQENMTFKNILKEDEVIVFTRFFNVDSSVVVGIHNIKTNDFKNGTIKKEQGLYNWHTIFQRLNGVELTDAVLTKNKILVMCSREKIYAINNKSFHHPSPNIKPVFKQITLNGDSILLSQKFPLALLSHEKNLKFVLSYPFHTNAEANMYSFKLEGFDDDWTDWNEDAEIVYQNLAPGKYSLKSRAMNYLGEVGSAEDLVFQIRMPYYFRWWAILVYFILFSFLIYAIVKWRTHELRKSKYQLEKAIQARTAEIEQQKAMLEEQNEKITEIDRLKTSFFMNLSHEFRTPLTLIMGPLKKLLQNNQNKILHDEYARMYKQSHKLNDYINQLLEITKIESGNIDLKLKTVDLKAFVNRSFAAFESLAAIKKINYEINVPEEKLMVDIDPEKFEIVLNNLLNNAFKFTPEEGQIKVLLECSNGTACIKVVDTGIGIAPENLEKIFNRFYQVEQSTVRKYEGTGIGLSLAKQLVSLHQGSIHVESMPGKGSKFSVYLPLQKKVPVEEVIIPKQTDIDLFEPQGTESSGSSDKNKKAILVVEDNKDMQHYIYGCLCDKYSVKIANNGLEGMQMCLQDMPDLVVSDVMMPEMDGYELCGNIRKNELTSHIPIILLTAKAGEESKLKGLELGSDDYLSKPFSHKELEVRVSNLLKQRLLLKEKYERLIKIKPGQNQELSLDEKFILKLGNIIEKNLTDSSFDVEFLSKEAGLSRRHLLRKLNALTGQSPSSFIRNYRLEKAAVALKNNSATVSEIAYQSGFDDLSYFSKCFKEKFGVTPSDYTLNQA